MTNSNGKFKLRFKVDSKILKELGENLISRPSIALAELVKNCYDADSTKVTISFNHITQKDGIIIIEDNGEGISREKLETAWMTVSTTEKIANPISKKYGRLKTGHKGIGRFACQALAHTLILETIAVQNDGVKRKIKGTFYWSEFDLGRKFVDVPIDFTITDVHPLSKTGTKLTLYKLHKIWEDIDVKFLKKEILSLIVPFDEEEFYVGGFEIFFEIPEFNKYSGKISQQIVQKAWGELKGEVSENGIISYELKTIQGIKRITLEKKMIFLGRCKFKIFYHYLPRGTRRVTREPIEEIGGIRVYVDGFRVFSYGQPDDDWLSLKADVARRLAAAPTEFRHLKADRPLLRLPENKHLVGGVFLSRDENSSIKQTINRDRLLQNEAYDELYYFVRKGIDWLTIKFAQYYDSMLKEKYLKEKEKRDAIRKIKKKNSNFLLKNVENIIKEDKIIIEKSLGKEKTTELVDKLSDLRFALKIEEEISTEKEQELIEILSLYRLLASVGTTVFIFEHETQMIIHYLKNISKSLKELNNYIDNSKKDFLSEIINSITKWHENIEKLASLTRLLEVKKTVQIRRRITFKSVIDEIENTFHNYITVKKIKFINDLNNYIRSPPMHTWELHSIFLNLLTNSIKAVISKDNHNDRIIRVWGEENNKNSIIYFQDTGIGINPDDFDKIFKPFYSTSEPDVMLGKGLGLGLTIVKDIVEEYKGKISFNKNMKIGTQVKLIFPNR